MIDKDEYKRAWSAIVERFGKDFNPKIAAQYYEFLNGQMETAEFLAAARTIWASAKWFPRPCDFLVVGMGDDWRRVDVWADPALSEAERNEKWAKLSPRAQEAVKRIGGLNAIRSTKDVLRLKAGFEQAYEQVAASEVLALPASPGRVSLPAA